MATSLALAVCLLVAAWITAAVLFEVALRRGRWLPGGLRPDLAKRIAAVASPLGSMRACDHLARELAGTGITVNTITPGYTRTEAAQGIADPETVARLRAWVVDQQIIKRSEEPADLAGTVIFLASEESDFITGQTINVNGGATHH